MSSTHHITLGDRTFKVVLTPEGGASVDGVPVPVSISQLEPGVLSLLLEQPDGTVRSFRCLADNSFGESAVLLNGTRMPYAISDPRSLRKGSSAAGQQGPRPLKAPMPGRIVRVLVADGDTVEAGQGCLVIEAMKMQNELKAPRAGVVARLTGSVGQTVASGDVLLVVE